MPSFYERILPASGEYVVVAIGPQGPREVTNLATVSAVEQVITKLSLHKLNVFVAIGSYAHHTPKSGDTPSKGGRKEPLLKRCLYLDLDPKEFGDKANALKQLQIFCRSTGFPGPSIYVDSGRGIHAYWTFNRNLDVGAWRALAGKLKEKCIEVAFPVDPVVTGDAARILRAPGTLNHKSDPPVPCRVLKDTGVDFDPAALLRALTPAPVAIASGSALAALAGMVSNDELGTAPDLAAYPKVPYYASEIASKCGVFKEALETGGRDNTEPQWRHQLGLLTFCEDGETYVHEISKGHPGYDPKATDKKYAQVLKLKEAGTLKPILCSTFGQYKGSICNGCPFNGNIKTPMVLGKLESTQYLPSNYRMGDFSVDKMVKKGDANTPDLWLPVFPYRITDVQVFEHGKESPRQLAFSCGSKRHLHPVRMSYDDLVSQGGELAMTLSRAGLNLGTQHYPEFKHIMSSWLRKMEDVRANTAVEQKGLGWGKRGGKDVFAAGGVVHGANNAEFDFYHADKKMTGFFTAKGDPTIWNRAALAISQDPRQAAVATLLTAFAAPLVPFASVKGLTFSLYSAGSGTGKSAVLRTAQSVWGHPVNGMAMIDDTQLSVINRLGFLNNIPAYWDELRSGESLIAFVKMIFTLGQGREKSRLTSGIKQQDTSTWDTLITLASNERLSDHIDRHIKNTDAGRLRLFEVTMPPLVNPDPLLMKVFDDLDDNYGHAGIQWAKWLVANKALAQSTVEKMQFAVAKKLRKNNNERFWIAFVALIMSAGALVNQAKILKVDLAKLQQWLFSQYIAQQTGVEVQYVKPEEAAIDSVIKYIDMNRDKMIVVDKVKPENGALQNVVTPSNMWPRGEILIQRGIEDHLIRIDLAAWRQWVIDELKHSPTTLLNELLQKPQVRMLKASLDAGLPNASNARRKVLQVDLQGLGVTVAE